MACQDDMIIVGVTKTRPSFGCDLAVKMGLPLYCTYDDAERIEAFATGGYDCEGELSDLLSVADVVVDCSPGKVGSTKSRKIQKCWNQVYLPRWRKTRNDWYVLHLVVLTTSKT